MRTFFSLFLLSTLLLSSCSQGTREIWYLERIYSSALLTKEKKKRNPGGGIDSEFNPRFESMFEDQTI